MRKVMVCLVAVMLLCGGGQAVGQQAAQTATPAPAQPQTGITGSEEMPAMMQQMTDNMQRVQQILAAGKLNPADLKKLQDMFNQMQVILNQMAHLGMMHMMQEAPKGGMMKGCPMMKEMEPKQPQTAAPEFPKPEVPLEKKP